MTSSSDHNGPDETIDADFEPAPAADYVVPKENASSAGPGWLPLGLVGALSLGALGVSATALSKGSVDPSGFAPASISEDLDAVREDQAGAAKELAQLKKATEASEKRMAAQVEALLSGDENSEGLAALVTELEVVSKRLDEAPIGGGDTEALDALEARLAALEEADDAEAVSPRQMNRAVTALRERVKTLEAQNEGLTAQLETRAEALATITARIEDMEFALQDAGGAVSPTQSDLLANLQKEIDSLKTTVERTEDIDTENEQRFSDMLKTLQDAGQAETQVNAEEATATVALALSRIEAAAREGRSFSVAYKQLQEAMPEEASVKALSKIARTGAPTLRQLATRFEGDRDAALEAVDVSAEDGWGWTRQVFGSGVKVRRAGEAGGPRDLLDKAAEALETGELKPAVEAVDDLPEEAKAVMQDWLASAKARLTLEDALDDISVKLIGRDR